jgi:rod shape-determining protein MreC
MWNNTGYQAEHQAMKLNVRFIVYIALALTLIFLDKTLLISPKIRQGFSKVAYPLQLASNVPVHIYTSVKNYLKHQGTLIEANKQLEEENLVLRAKVVNYDALLSSHNQLKATQQLMRDLPSSPVVAEVKLTQFQTFAPRFQINKGQRDGLILGQPVIDDKGLLGTITHVDDHTASVGLISDDGFITPVENARSQERALLYGDAGDVKLAYLSKNADIQEGDMYVTSGLDGVYPKGIAVVRVLKVDRKVGSSFVVVDAEPVSEIHHSHYVIVLRPSVDGAPKPLQPTP